MKKFFIFVCASMFCVTAFAETVKTENVAEEPVVVENVSDFTVETTSELNEMGESMGPNSDGFIYKGTITLTRVASGIRETFCLFNKGGVDYVAPDRSGPYFRLCRRMTIYGIDYKL